MKKKVALSALLALMVAATAAGCSGEGGGSAGDDYQDHTANKQPGDGQFDFNGNYTQPELTIDGKADEAEWKAIEEPLVRYGRRVNGEPAVSVKVHRGERALFLLFDVKDPILLTQGVTNDDAVTHGDSIEFYLDTKADGGRTPQSDDFQINLGIHGKTRIMQGSGSNWGAWNGLIDYEVDLHGTLNDDATPTDEGYTIEVMVQYQDIMIDKDDTIAVAFGQVDKVREEDAGAGSEDGAWNWYGLEYNGALVEPQRPDNYLLLDKDNNLMSRDEEKRPPADMVGTVLDERGAPIAGAAVTATWKETELTATTDEAGSFTFAQVDPEGTYQIVIEKDGYLTANGEFTRAELRAANGGKVSKSFTVYALEALVTTTATGNVKNVVTGGVEGVDIAVKGSELATKSTAGGAFSLAGIPVVPGSTVTLLLTKSGYQTGELVLKAEDLVGAGETSLGDVNISLPAAATGPFGIASGLANNEGFISRTLTGVEFRFEGSKTFNGWVELFVDTKQSDGERSATDFMLQLKADGTVSIVNYGGNFTLHGIEWTVTPKAEGGYTARALLPYDMMGISPLEPFGISLGQSNGQTVWDGWGRADMIGTNGIGFVAPEIPTDYVRVAADNTLYEGANNELVARLSGKVENAAGTGIAGVTVKVGAQTTTTNDAGEWSLKAVVTEDITIRYEKTGYVAGETQLTKAQLAVGSYRDCVTLQDATITISGKVTDGTGAGIADVTVSVTGEHCNFTAQTNAQGEYTLAGVTLFEDVAISFTKTDYVTVSENITVEQLLAGDMTKNVTMQSSSFEKQVTLSGTVTAEDAPLAGVTVAVGTHSTVTNDKGGWELNLSVAYNQETTISYTLAGYTTKQTVIPANTFESETTWKEVCALEAIKTTLSGSVKNAVLGAVEGATVSVKGDEGSTTTASGGAFSLENIYLKDGDVTLVISKEGYAATELVVAAADFTQGGITQLGEVGLDLPAAEAGIVASGANKAADKQQYFVKANVTLTRTLEGILFRFDGERVLGAGAIELYIDVKESMGSRDEETSAWRIDLRADGSISGTHFKGGQFTAEGLKYTVRSNTSETGYNATLLIPYTYLDIAANETIGFSMGQWSDQASDWDGWDFDGAFVAPEQTTGYLRFGALHQLYRANNNAAVIRFAGNAGQAGVLVAIGTQRVTTQEGGAWALDAFYTGDALSISYTKAGYVSKTTQLTQEALAGMVRFEENVSLEELHVTISGVVTDETQSPVEGVSVTLTIGQEQKNTTTNSLGQYSFEGVTTFEGVTLTFAKEGYAESAPVAIAQADLAAQSVITRDQTLISLSGVQQITLTGSVNGIGGALQGVTVTVEGKEYTAITDEQGNFTIENFECVDGELTFTLAGYLQANVTFSAGNVGDAPEYALPALFLAKEYTALGGTIAAGKASSAKFAPYVTRGESAFLFRFVGSNAFAGTVEMFVDSGLSAGWDARNTTDYRFDLRADGSIGVVNFGNGNNTATATLSYTVGGMAETPVLNFAIPYAFLGVERDDVIGVSFGQVCGADGWDGWAVDALKGVDGVGFVRPELPWDYVRIGVDNLPFANAENIAKDVLDLSEYKLHFGKGNDSIHAKLTRDGEGITFDFVSLGDFGTHEGNLEAILLYFDRGEPAAGWGVDYQYKIVSDGNVYGNNSAWWAASDATKKATIQIDRTNGITRLSYKVLYSDLGATAEETVGFTLVEGWLTSDNNSDEYANGLLFEISGGTYRVGDAANTSGYLRIKADGSIVVANSNANA